MEGLNEHIEDIGYPGQSLASVNAMLFRIFVILFSHCSAAFQLCTIYATYSFCRETLTSIQQVTASSLEKSTLILTDYSYLRISVEYGIYCTKYAPP